MAEYKNSLRSKKILKEALIDLLSSGRNFNDITITMLINKANINRGTFYNHYSNVVDIVAEIKDELLENLLQILEKSMKGNNTIENLFDVITDFLKENENEYKKLAPIAPKQIYDGMKNQAIKHLNSIAKTTTKKEKLLVQYLANSIAGTYIDYFENRLNVSLDELKEYSIKVTQKFLASGNKLID